MDMNIWHQKMRVIAHHRRIVSQQRMIVAYERRRQMAVIECLCYVLHALTLRRTYYSFRCISYNREERENIRQELMHQLKTSPTCRNIIRMGPEAFARLVELLKETGRLKDSTRSTVEEHVAIFLHILGLTFRNRTISFYFRRSGETISRNFHNVLRAVISLEDKFLVQPNGSEVPAEILHSSRFYPYFKDCVGALDGTHIRVKVPKVDAPRFRGRKDFPTQNVLAACSFDLKFTYVLPGWEGTASDSRIIKNALTREDKLIIPPGKYYLADAGYPLMAGVLTPYRGVRYHLKEYSTRAPETKEEIFNHRHSSLRNVIERAFGVVKKRFPIIASMNEPYYSFSTQTEIVLACCILHNFLMTEDPDESLIAEVDRDILTGDVSRDAHATSSSDEDARQGAVIRDNIAATMWNDYILRRS